MLTKIFVLLAVLVVVWFVFSIIEKRRKKANAKPHNRANSRPNNRRRKRKPSVIDLEQCASCGAWVSGACKKPECAGKG